MIRIMIIAGVLFAGGLTAGGQTNLVMEAIEHHGTITFTTLTNAQSYRVEWSPNAGATWTSFTAAAEALDQIETTGVASVTVSVPTLYRVVATVTDPLPNVDPLTNMVLIPAGSFVMGNATNVLPASDGNPHELPQHDVTVSAFYIDQSEITGDLWDTVKAFGEANGYTFGVTPTYFASNHPVVSVSWHDAVKWCNARSERAGLTPVYYTDAFFTTPYRFGEINAYADWSADGYRLPTEAEWEKAARGGVPDTRFPWTDYTNNISWAKANFIGLSSILPYDLSGSTFGERHPDYRYDDPGTNPVDAFAPNGYGLYGMAGNAAEWCWDTFDANYYLTSPSTDPRGPVNPGSQRVLRGGAWTTTADVLRIADRRPWTPNDIENWIGFRCVKAP